MLSVFLAMAAATAPVPVMTVDWWSDYYDTPTKGLAKGELSVVVAEMTINKHGYFDNCVGKVYAGNPQMGPYVCSRLRMRAVFEPAHGSDGRKVIGVYRKLIVVANVREDTQFKAPQFGIRIPGPAPQSSENPFEIQFYLNEAGQVSDCTLIDSIGINLLKHKQVVDPALVQRACAEIPVQLKPVPPVGKNGKPIPTAQNALVVVEKGIVQHNQQ